MATPNYGYEKRQRELAKRKKKEEKLKAKAERKVSGVAGDDGLAGGNAGDEGIGGNDDSREQSPPSQPLP